VGTSNLPRHADAAFGVRAVARGLWRAGCGARVHRDVNGSANSCSKAAYGRYSTVQADTIK